MSHDLREPSGGGTAGGSAMRSWAWAALAAVVFVATFYFTYWVPFSLISSRIPDVVAAGVAVGGALLGAVAATAFFWRRGRTWREGARRAPDATTRSLGAYAGTGALAVGGLGFVLGFFGPIVFTPASNQGPLLGLFVTGPGGALLGAIGGWVYGVARRRAG